MKRHVPKEPSTTGRRSKPTERRGERIIAGRYDLLRLIGKGGMAAVYLADDA